ncbi:MAG: DUF3943 domain-containing protein [Treponema sp.]|nr:DUF3943 domain-containing protein [Candidatus Treponema equifaecale]
MRKFLSVFILFSLLFTSESFAFEKETLAFSENSSGIVFDVNKLSFGSASGEYDEAKHPLVAIGGMLAFSELLYSYNRWVCNAPWAQTGYNEYNKFWTRELKWDNDWYWTNFVLHPYQGGLYYMAARGSNLNQLESFGVTVLGSSIWEYLCETNAPSKNDMVYTTLGAFAVGEMLYRLSQEANEISRILGVALNPQRLWTEYLWGINQKPSSGNIYAMTASLGAGTARANTKFSDSKFDEEIFSLPKSKRNEIFPAFGSVDVDIAYRDPYTHDSNTPYDQFEFFMQVGLGKSSDMGAHCQYEDLDEKLFYDIQLITNGSLISRSIQGENTDTSFGLVFEYDFDWHSFYQISSLAPGFAIKQRIKKDSSKIEWQAHFDGVVLGTADSYYEKRKFIKDAHSDSAEYSARPYSYNSGFENLLKFKYATDSGHTLALDFRGYALYDFSNQLISGMDTGWELFGNLKASYELPLSETVRLGVSDELYAKKTFFNKFENYRQVLNTAKVFVKLKLK